jgi:TPR repeat protein
MAADQGFAVAQYNLGVCYYQGTGVEKDEVEGVKWYRKAADQGFAGAQHNLGLIYAHGKGVKQDGVEAYMWALLASHGGNQKAQELIDSMQSLTAEQKAEGLRRAKEFKKSLELKNTGADIPRTIE